VTTLITVAREISIPLASIQFMPIIFSMQSSLTNTFVRNLKLSSKSVFPTRHSTMNKIRQRY